jgi:pyruvate ferredoxin oxidoreductase alpha subunit
LDTDAVRQFVGEYTPENYLLKKENPMAVGPYDISNYYMEHKVQEAEAMKSAKGRILEVAEEFEKISGRRYGLFEEYRMEDAQLAVVLMGSTAGTAKAAIDALREKGVKAGLIKVRVFRPFPGEELASALSKTKAVAVMDKSEGFSANGGPLFAETRSALYDLKERPQLINIVYGLGGRDVKTEDIENVFGRWNLSPRRRDRPVYTHMGQRQRSNRMSTVYNLKQEVEKTPRLTGGHRLCAGCGAGIVVSGFCAP